VSVNKKSESIYKEEVGISHILATQRLDDIHVHVAVNQHARRR